MPQRLDQEISRLVAEARDKGARVDVMSISRKLSQGAASRDFRAILNLVLQEVYRSGGKSCWDAAQPQAVNVQPTAEYVRRPPLSREERKARDEERAREAAEARSEARQNAVAFRENMLRLRNLRLARDRNGGSVPPDP